MCLLNTCKTGAEESMVTLEQKKKEALEYLERVQAAGCGAGQVWWMKRGMYEKQKFLPTGKKSVCNVCANVSRQCDEPVLNAGMFATFICV